MKETFLVFAFGFCGLQLFILIWMDLVRPRIGRYHTIQKDRIQPMWVTFSAEATTVFVVCALLYAFFLRSYVSPKVAAVTVVLFSFAVGLLRAYEEQLPGNFKQILSAYKGFWKWAFSKKFATRSLRRARVVLYAGFILISFAALGSLFHLWDNPFVGKGSFAYWMLYPMCIWIFLGDHWEYFRTSGNRP